MLKIFFFKIVIHELEKHSNFKETEDSKEIDKFGGEDFWSECLKKWNKTLQIGHLPFSNTDIWSFKFLREK